MVGLKQLFWPNAGQYRQLSESGQADLQRLGQVWHIWPYCALLRQTSCWLAWHLSCSVHKNATTKQVEVSSAVYKVGSISPGELL